MKEGWEYKKLGEVCCPKKDIKRANKCFQKEDAIRYIDISSVDNTSNAIASYSDYIFQDAPSRAQQVVENDDIVLSLVRPNLKNIAIVKDSYENMVASSGFCVLRVNKIIDNRYLFYIVTSPTYTEYLLKNVSGANYPAVTEEIVKKWEFPLPPLSEQQSIVAELDKINEIIDLKKAQLKDLDLLAQSIFYDMFGDPIENPKGWEVKSVGSICSDVKYGTSKPACEGGKYKYLRMNNLTADGHLDFSNLKYIDIPDSEIEKCIVRKGDILFNRTNSIELVGKTCEFTVDEPMVIAGYIIRVRLLDAVLPTFFSICFNTPAIKK